MTHEKKVEQWQQVYALKCTRAIGPRSTRAVSHMTSHRAGQSRSQLPRLCEPLSLDPIEQTAWVEPGVTMEQLCAFTLKAGLVPPIVPEFRAITVGGAIMGAALESAAFRAGQFSDNCLEYELLLGNGEKVCVSPQVNPDLFYGVSGSYGAFAMLTAVKLRLEKAEDFVKLDYHLVESAEEALALFSQLKPDYLDAVALHSRQLMVMAGYRIGREQLPQDVAMTRLGRPYSVWFAQRVLEKAHKGQKTDYISLTDYLFRYDRGAFWMGQFVTSKGAFWKFLFERGLSGGHLAEQLHAAFRADPPTLNPSFLFRLCCGWKLSSRSLYRILHALPENAFGETFIVQDFYIPKKALPQFLKEVEQKTGIYPLWLCPIKGTTTPQFLSPHYLSHPSSDDFDFVNVGVYGVPNTASSPELLTTQLEEIAYRMGGRKVLYAINYLTEAAFWKAYDEERYHALRQASFSVGVFPDLYLRTHEKKR